MLCWRIQTIRKSLTHDTFLYSSLFPVEKLKLEAWLVNSCISVDFSKLFKCLHSAKPKAYYANHLFPLIFQLMYVFREI